MYGFVDDIIVVVGEGYIIYVVVDFCVWVMCFDLLGCFNEVDCVFVMFFDISCYCKNIWIENDVLWGEVYLLS